jgi:hypothetical protein
MLAIIFAVYAIVVVNACVYLVGKHHAPKQSKVLAGFFSLWLLYTGLVGLYGGLLDHPDALPPRLFLFLLAPMIAFTVIFQTNPKISSLFFSLPTYLLIGFQSFRIGVEFLLDAMNRAGLVPVSMTYRGQNMDILAGFSALFMMGFARSRWSDSRKILIAWNIFGLITVTNVVVRGLLSFPSPFRRFFEEISNTAVGQAPYIWLPAVFVFLAYNFHIFSIRKLWSEMKKGAT